MKRLLLAAALSVAGLANAIPVSGFNGDFVVANWDSSGAPPGSIDTTGAPNSISLTSGSDDSGNPSFTNFFILFPVSATVSFSWAYKTLDDGGPLFDPFGYVLADAVGDLEDSFAQLTNDNAADAQSGSASVFVQAGQYFGFSAWTVDNIGGAATTTISNLQIPEPSSLLLLGLALAAAGAATHRRRTA